MFDPTLNQDAVSQLSVAPAPLAPQVPQASAMAPMVPSMQPGVLDASLAPLQPDMAPGVEAPQPPGLVPRTDQEITRLVESGMLSPETGAGLLRSNQRLAQRRRGIRQKFETATRRNVKEQQRYTEDVQKLSDERAADETELLTRMQGAEAEYRANAQGLQERYQATQEQVMQQVNELEEDLSRQQIDPNRTMRGWRGVGSAVAIALGELGRAFTGGPNAAMAIINRNIDRDIAAQKMARQTIRERIAGKTNEYQRNRERFGDEQAAIAATRASAYRAIETQAKIFEAQTKNEDQKTRAQELAMQAQQQAEANILQAGQLELDYQLRLEQFDFNQRLAMAQRTQGWQELARQRMRLAKAGVRGEPLYKEATREAMQLKDESEKMQDTVDKIQELVFKPGAVGREWLPSKEAAVAKALATDLQLRIGKQMGLGALSEADLEMVETIIGGDPTRIRQAVSQAQLDSLRDKIKTGINIELKNRGFELIPGETSMAVQPYEQPVGMQTTGAQR